MDHFDTAQMIAIASVLGFASGLRLYLVLFAVGLAGYLQWVPLPPGCSCSPIRGYSSPRA